MAITAKRSRQSGAPKPPRKQPKVDYNSESSKAAKGKQRSRPVTAPLKEDDDSEDEDASEEGDEVASADDELENADEEDDHEEIAANAAASNKQNAREAHQVQKSLHTQRKAAKPHSELLSRAKSLWTRARQKNLPKEERAAAIAELAGCVRGHVQEIVFKHDASRIVQTIVKYGSKTERNTVAMELSGKYKDLAQNKYSKFLVTKLIRLCPTHRPSILGEFRGHVLRLLVHREAGRVLADAYELYASAYERALLVRDFYGREVALFDGVGAGAGTKGKDKEKDKGKSKASTADDAEKGRVRKGLEGVLEGVDEERRRRILSAVKENLDIVLNNPDKGAVAYALFHHALLKYLLAISTLGDAAERERLWREIFEASQEVLAEMVHTNDGSRVVREFLARGTAKDRKQIVKVLKPHIVRISTDDDAQLVLFTALDVIDDTKLTTKSLLSPLLTHLSSAPSALPSLYTTPAGRRTLLYPLVPRSLRHYTPAITSLLSAAEEFARNAGTSKKDPAVRRAEVAAGWGVGVLAVLVPEGGKDEQMEKALRDPGGCLFVLEVLLYGDGDKDKAIASLVRLLKQTYPSSDTSTPHIISIPPASRLLKTLLQGGHFSQKTHSIERAPAERFSTLSFARAWLADVGAEQTRALASGEGTFVVAALCERIKEEGIAEERKTLKGWFRKGFKETLGDVRGAKVLLGAIDSL